MMSKSNNRSKFDFGFSLFDTGIFTTSFTFGLSSTLCSADELLSLSSLLEVDSYSSSDDLLVFLCQTNIMLRKKVQNAVLTSFPLLKLFQISYFRLLPIQSLKNHCHQSLYYCCYLILQSSVQIPTTYLSFCPKKNNNVPQDKTIYRSMLQKPLSA